jgi:hypothetical protein
MYNTILLTVVIRESTICFSALELIRGRRITIFVLAYYVSVLARKVKAEADFARDCLGNDVSFGSWTRGLSAISGKSAAS